MVWLCAWHRSLQQFHRACIWLDVIEEGGAEAGRGIIKSSWIIVFCRHSHSITDAVQEIHWYSFVSSSLCSSVSVRRLLDFYLVEPGIQISTAIWGIPVVFVVYVWWEASAAGFSAHQPRGSYMSSCLMCLVGRWLGMAVASFFVGNVYSSWKKWCSTMLTSVSCKKSTTVRSKSYRHRRTTSSNALSTPTEKTILVWKKLGRASTGRHQWDFRLWAV